MAARRHHDAVLLVVVRAPVEVVDVERKPPSRSAQASSTSRPAAITSGPMPSPRLLALDWPPAITAAEGRLALAWSGEAYAALKTAIRDNVFPPGHQATEAEIARQLGMSRTPVHEAIIRLQEEGLVQVLSRRGVLICPISADDIREIYDVLIAVEGMAASLLAQMPGRGAQVGGSVTRRRDCADGEGARSGGPARLGRGRRTVSRTADRTLRQPAASSSGVSDSSRPIPPREASRCTCDGRPLTSRANTEPSPVLSRACRQGRSCCARPPHQSAGFARSAHPPVRNAKSVNARFRSGAIGR